MQKEENMARVWEYLQKSLNTLQRVDLDDLQAGLDEGEDSIDPESEDSDLDDDMQVEAAPVALPMTAPTIRGA